MNKTMNERINDWKERCQIMCSCKKDTIVFMCKEASCPSNKTQSVYCQECIVAGPHFHPLNYISDEISEVAKQWIAARANL